MAQPQDTYYEAVFKGPWTGVNSSMPENMINNSDAISMQNIITRNGELRSRPKVYQGIPGPPDNSTISGHGTFQDSNNVLHTCIVTATGLWQLNSNWPNLITKLGLSSIWNRVGLYPIQPGNYTPAGVQTFINTFYWVNGGSYLWSWDGIRSKNSLGVWTPSTQYLVGQQIVDSNGNWQIVTQAGPSGTPTAPVWSTMVGGITTEGTGALQWTENGKPIVANGGIQSTAIVNAATGLQAGAYFLGEIGAHLVMLNTNEGGSIFPQRMRWSPSGIPNIWDPNVNIGAGWNDFLDVPDNITGALFVGTTGLIIRSNGVTEVSINAGSGINPFIFNHLWGSDRGIGNIYPFSLAQYGPIGIFISTEDIYEYSIGGFNDIAGVAHTAIYNDLYAATGTPVATIFPQYQGNYIYLTYHLTIPQGMNTKVWRYSIKDKSWQSDLYTGRIFTGQPKYVAVT